MATLPEGAGLNISLEQTERPARTFIIDWSTERIVGMVDGLAAMEQTVDIILHSERFRWQIYGSSFGSELKDLAGEEEDYIETEIPRRIRDAFSVDERILSEENFVYSGSGNGEMSASFDVVTVYGIFRKEVALW